MKNLLCLIAILLSLAMPAMSKTSGEGQSKDEIVRVVNRLFEAMKARDAEAIRRLFSAEGRLVSTFVRGDQVSVRILTVEAFAKMAAETREPFIERMFEMEVRLDGDLATVWGKYDFHVGERLTNCGVNSFQLLRAADGWKILHIASTIHTQGCEKTGK